MRAKKERPRPACWTKATELLGQQELSSAKLAEKLRQRGYEAEEIAAVIARLQERRFLNDAEAAARQVNYFYTDERLSMRAIRQKLRERGFSSEDIDAAMLMVRLNEAGYEYERSRKQSSGFEIPHNENRQS